VLRRQSSPRNVLDGDCVEHFARAVLWHYGASIVIASTWRLAYSLDELRGFFPADLGNRIEGKTPELIRQADYARHREVRAYLRRRRLQDSPWIAVDDDPGQFRPGAPLIDVDPARGFDAVCAARLRHWLAARSDATGP